MQDAWRAYLELALGLTEEPRRKAQKVAGDLISKGGQTAAQLQGLVEDMVSTGMPNREALTTIVRYEVDRALGLVGLATAEEVAELTARVRDLERQLRDARAGGPATGGGTVAASAGNAAEGGSPAAPTPAKKAVAKKAVAKKAVTPTTAAKKAVAKKAVAPTTVAKTTPATKAVTPTAPAEKAVTPTTPAAKAVTPAGPAQKAVAKRAVAKTAVAKKAVAKKAVAKTAVAKKAVAEKAAPAGPRAVGAPATTTGARVATPTGTGETPVAPVKQAPAAPEFLPAFEPVTSNDRAATVPAPAQAVQQAPAGSGAGEATPQGSTGTAAERPTDRSTQQGAGTETHQ
ncbi:histone H1-like repetitive region-containing protein [Krasilnikovia sp. MM14-A1259]|uniref:histone H1-like repetitive region-containing protein n=1 Tax=Krasilnikovia sp. MM14-A1259 TaxID=3373539 RepID=UPI003810DD23